MRFDLSLVPTEDLKALRDKNYAAVSTSTLRYLKTGDPKDMQKQAAENDTMPRSIPQAWSEAWGVKNPTGRGRLGYHLLPPEEWNNQNELSRRLSEGVKNDVKDMVRAAMNPVGTAEGALINAMAPFAALDKDGKPYIDPYSPFMPRFSKGPGHAPEVPKEYLDRQRGLKQALDAAWEAEKGFVSRNVKDPKGIPGRALDYAIDHPVNTVLNVSPVLGFAGKVAAVGKFGTAAEALAKAQKYTSPMTPVKWAGNKVLNNLGDWPPRFVNREPANARQAPAGEKATGSRFPLRLPETWYQKTIQGFINQIGRLRHSKPTRQEIFSRFGNDFVPVGEIDASTMKLLGVRDPKVYTGEAYFIDHHFNHHPENIPARYRTIPDVLSHWDDIKVDPRPGREGGYIFIKRYDRYHTLVTRVGEEEGRLMLYKTLMVPTREPYKKFPSIKDRPVGEGGHASIGSAPQRGAPPEAVSGLPTGRDASVPEAGREIKQKSSAIRDNPPSSQKGKTPMLRWLTDPDLQREYVRRAAGDVDKARELAREDGWLW